MRLKHQAVALGTAVAVGFVLGARATAIAARAKLDEIEAAMMEIRSPSIDGMEPAADETPTLTAQWFEDHPITQRVKAQERAAEERARARGNAGAVARVREGLGSNDPSIRDEWA